MGRPCTICELAEAERERVEEAIVSGRSLRDVAATFRVGSKDAVRRHRQGHMPVALIRLGKKAIDAEQEATKALSVLDRMENLYDRLNGMLDRAEKDGKITIGL